MEKKTTKQIVTEGWITERVALEILMKKCDSLTVKEVKNLARDISTQIRNALLRVEEENLSITDEQATDRGFWISQIINSGKDFNQTP